MHVIGKDILRFHAVYWPGEGKLKGNESCRGERRNGAEEARNVPTAHRQKKHSLLSCGALGSWEMVKVGEWQAIREGDEGACHVRHGRHYALSRQLFECPLTC